MFQTLSGLLVLTLFPWNFQVCGKRQSGSPTVYSNEQTAGQSSEDVHTSREQGTEWYQQGMYWGIILQQNYCIYNKLIFFYNKGYWIIKIGRKVIMWKAWDRLQNWTTLSYGFTGFEPLHHGAINDAMLKGGPYLFQFQTCGIFTSTNHNTCPGEKLHVHCRSDKGVLRHPLILLALFARLDYI